MGGACTLWSIKEGGGLGPSVLRGPNTTKNPDIFSAVPNTQDKAFNTFFMYDLQYKVLRGNAPLTQELPAFQLFETRRNMISYHPCNRYCTNTDFFFKYLTYDKVFR